MFELLSSEKYKKKTEKSRTARYYATQSKRKLNIYNFESFTNDLPLSEYIISLVWSYYEHEQFLVLKHFKVILSPRAISSCPAEFVTYVRIRDELSIWIFFLEWSYENAKTGSRLISSPQSW